MAHGTKGIGTPPPGTAQRAAPAGLGSAGTASQAARSARWEIDLSDEVAAWYARLGARGRAYADRAFDRLARHGPALGMPHGRVIGDGLHELRFACEGVSRRVTYTLGEGRQVLALTTFRKQRTRERQEVERAAQAQARVAERENGRSRAW